MDPDRRAGCVTRPLIDARGALWIASLLTLALFLVASAGAQALSAPSGGQPLSAASHEVGTEAPTIEDAGDELDGSPADDRQNSPQATSTQALPGGLPAALLLGVGAVAAVSAGGLLVLTHRRQDSTTPSRAPAEPASEAITSIDDADVDDGIEPEEITLEFPADLPPGLGGILRLGQRAVDDGEYEEAAVWFRTALDVEPDLPVAHLCLGLCRGEVEGPEAALASLDRAVDLDPTNAMARYCRAQALARGGQTGAVIDALAPLAPGTDAMAEAILADPAFADLRDHPRLLALLGRL